MQQRLMTLDQLLSSSGFPTMLLADAIASLKQPPLAGCLIDHPCYWMRGSTKPL